MPRVSRPFTIETVHEPDDSYRFALVTEDSGVTARSTSAYASEANAMTAATRMTGDGAIEADVVEHDGGWVVRLLRGGLEAVTTSWPDRAQAEAVLRDLTG